MSDTHRPSPDVLDAATAALRAAAVPPGPPDRLIADTLTTAAAVAAALFALPARSPANELKKAEQAKTVRVQIETDTGRDSPMTVTSHIAGDKLRAEFQPRGLVLVVNGQEERKGLMLLTKMQTYRELDPDKDPLVKQVTADVKQALAQFKTPADDQVKGLPDEDLGGRTTKVYEVKGVDLPEMRAKADLKMWVDPKTGLPVQSRVTAKVQGRTVTTTTAKYLGFDE